jgi:hypothetical protein
VLVKAVVGAAVEVDVETSGVLANLRVGVAVMAEVGSNAEGLEGEVTAGEIAFELSSICLAMNAKDLPVSMYRSPSSSEPESFPPLFSRSCSLCWSLSEASSAKSSVS